jgi:hypothetical protein
VLKEQRHDKQWAEIMGWLVGGGGGVDDERCRALEAGGARLGVQGGEV